MQEQITAPIIEVESPPKPLPESAKVALAKTLASLPPSLTLLNEKQFCAITGQTVSSVRANRIRGKGCKFCKIGGLVRYRLPDIIEYLEACERTSTTYFAT